VIDLAEDNIGTVKYGVTIEDGRKDITELLNWCHLILATGSTVVNGSIANFLIGKPVIFYGTTIAGPAALLGLRRFCPRGNNNKCCNLHAIPLPLIPASNEHNFPQKN